MQTTTSAQIVGKNKLPSPEQLALDATIKQLIKKVNRVVCMATPLKSGFLVTFDADGELYDAIIEKIELIADGHELFLSTFFGTNETVPTIRWKQCKFAYNL